jgi:hypothetical protein
MISTVSAHHPFQDKKQKSHSEFATFRLLASCEKMHTWSTVVSDGERIATILFTFGIFLPSVLVASTLFIKYRKHPMIERRKPQLVLFEIANIVVSFLAYNLPTILLEFPKGVTAEMFVILSALCGWIAYSTSIYRLGDLSITLMIAGQMGKTGLFNLKDLMKENIWVKLQRYRRFPYNYATILLVSGVLYIPMLAALLEVSRRKEHSLEAVLHIYRTQNPIPSFVCFVVGFITALYMNWKVRTQGAESLGIVRELHGKMLVLVMFLVNGLLSKVPWEFQADYFRPHVVALWIGFMIEIQVTLFRVVAVVHKEERRKRRNRVKAVAAGRRQSISVSELGHPQRVKLDFVLNNPQVLELFREFLTKELSLEHLLFIEAVMKFHEKYDQVDEEDAADSPSLSWATYVQDCKQMYRDFVDSEGLAPVNISHVNRGDVQRRVMQISHEDEGIPDPDFFKAAYVEVSTLLSMDSLNRFRRDPGFTEFMKKYTGSSPATSVHSQEDKHFFWPPKHRKSPSIATTATRDTKRQSFTAEGISQTEYSVAYGVKKTVSTGTRTPTSGQSQNEKESEHNVKVKRSSQIADAAHPWELRHKRNVSGSGVSVVGIPTPSGGSSQYEKEFSKHRKNQSTSSRLEAKDIPIDMDELDDGHD